MSDNKKDSQAMILKRTDSNLTNNFNGFFRNEHHSFAVLKTEKLASALYMVSGFVSENDPLRTRLRSCALDLMSCITDGKRTKEGVDQEGFGSRCLEIGTLLAMAERSGLVSPMNSKILCEEYAALASFVQANRDQVFGSGTIDLSTRAPKITSSSQTFTQRQTAVFGKRPIPKKTPNYKRHQTRRDIILSLFDKKDKINVKDASAAIEGCSEKTIQRELTAMVSEGVLLKEGERRWSTYKKAV